MGAGVLISMQYGAKDYDKLCLQLSSTLIGGLVFSAAVAIVSVIAAIPLVFVCKLGMAALPFSYLCGWFAMLIAEVPLLVSKMKEQ